MNKYPKILNQKKILKEICFTALLEKGIAETDDVKNRLNYELEMINRTELDEILLILREAIIKVRFKPYTIYARGLLGSSLVAYLLGINPINPLDYGLSQYLCYGLSEKVAKELNINISLPSLDMREKLIREIEKNDSIYKLLKPKSRIENGKIINHPSGYLMIPKNDCFNEVDYKNIERKVNEVYYNETDEFNKFYKLDIHINSSLDLLCKLSEKTKTNPMNISLEDGDIINYISGNDYHSIFLGISGFDNDFSNRVCSVIKPKSFMDCVKILSIGIGSGIWKENTENLFVNGNVNINTCLADREDVFEFLIKNGLTTEEAYFTTESLRKGNGLINASKLNNKIPKWFINYCSKIKFLSTKANSINMMLIYWRNLWYKIHYSDEYKFDYTEKIENQ